MVTPIDVYYVDVCACACAYWPWRSMSLWAIQVLRNAMIVEGDAYGPALPRCTVEPHVELQGTVGGQISWKKHPVILKWPIIVGNL